MSQNRYILITGVSTGIGLDAVEYFISLGYHVFGSVRSQKDFDRLTETFPDQFTGLLFDVTDRSAIAQAVTQVEACLDGGTLTALVNNAGIATAGPIQLLDAEAFEQNIEINVFGTRNVTNAFLPALGASSKRPSTVQPGKIINISSISGFLNTPMNGTYCVAKHAMESLGEVYRRELMMYGIDVISIQSGPIQSEIWTKSDGELAPYRDSDYKVMVERTEEILKQARKQAVPAREISTLIEKIIDAKKPATRYVVHSSPWKVKMLAHLFPARWVDRLLFKQLNK